MALSFLDMVRNTLDKLPVDGEFATVLPYHNWYVADELWRQNRRKKSGGVYVDVRIAYRVGESTQFVEAAAIRNPSMTEYTVSGKLPLVTTYFEVVHVEKEIRDNVTATASRGKRAEQIIDILKVRRQQELLGFYKTQEEKFFLCPTESGANKTPHGIPYHLPPITSAQVGGTGDVQGAYQGVHGYGASYWQNIDISDTTYSDLESYNACWDAASATTITMTEENKIRLARMFRRLHWSSPLSVEQLAQPMFSKLRVLTDETIVEQIGIAAQAQNDNLGADILKYVGTKGPKARLGMTDSGPLVNGLPARWAEVLDTADTTARGYHPLYMLNMDYLQVACEASNFMKKRPAATDAVHQPDVIVEYVDSTFNYIVPDRQKVGGVISWVS